VHDVFTDEKRKEAYDAFEKLKDPITKKMKEGGNEDDY